MTPPASPPPAPEPAPAPAAAPAPAPAPAAAAWSAHGPGDEARPGPWVLLVVDDEPDVHDVTSLVLSDLEFDGRPVEILAAYSGEEARQLFAQRDDIAVALVDVVMEHDRAGLELVRHVREQLGNRLTRIILRTGQPGMAPEREIVTHFEIDDYKEKTELTADRLYTAVYSALRSCQSLRRLEQARAGLARMAEEAEAASRAKSQFMANVSHEIRTPLNAVLGMLKLLQGTELTARQSDYVHKTERAARSLLVLLNDVLDFSKAEADKMTLDPRPFRIDQLLRDLSVILAASVGTKPVEVLFDIDPALPRSLVGDDLRLQQILINLGGNAVKFTDAGEVVLGLRVLESTPQDVLLAFSVRDTGIGIARPQQAHIFSGFSQAEASTTRRYGGTGLGLAICQRLVNLMGGHIELDSEPGLGSTFRFTLRLGLAPEVQAPGQAALSELGALSVLVVDDNATARQVLAEMARSLGWRADEADSGPRALELARRQVAAGQPYDAVFVDWQMPGMDGWETSQGLKQLGSGADPALVMMVTAHGREMIAQRSTSEQAALGGFLVKPVTASMLLDAVADARLGRRPGLDREALPPQPSAPRLAGLRLLLVEDNPNNQQVAQELLQSEGAIVSVADNGAEGLRVLQAAEGRFDVVLMDLQMPVMDGLTATRRIREEPRWSGLPIVAMTANAMASDRQACLQAGMTDHVGKPFDLADLVTVLRRAAGWGEDESSSPAPRGAGPLPVAALGQAQALEVQLEQAVQRLGGRADVYARMLGQFMKDLPRIERRIEEAALAQDWAQAAAQVHTLKGLAGTLGALSWHALLGSAERAFSAGAMPASQARALLDQILGRSARWREGAGALIAALQGEGKAGHDGPVSPDQTRQGVDRLLRLLKASDLSALQVHEQIRPGLLAAWPGDLNRALEDALAALDFDAAAACCQRILAASADR